MTARGRVAVVLTVAALFFLVVVCNPLAWVITDLETGLAR